MDGPGGTGKTFLYKALLARVRSEGLIAIATATSGIAASILPEDAQHTQDSKSLLNSLTIAHATSQSKVALRNYFAQRP